MRWCVVELTHKKVLKWVFYLKQDIFSEETLTATHGPNAVLVTHFRGCWSTIRLRPDRFGAHKMLLSIQTFRRILLCNAMWTMTTPSWKFWPTRGLVQDHVCPSGSCGAHMIPKKASSTPKLWQKCAHSQHCIVLKFRLRQASCGRWSGSVSIVYLKQVILSLHQLFCTLMFVRSNIFQSTSIITFSTTVTCQLMCTCTCRCG